jgi:hypothetical protein
MASAFSDDRQGDDRGGNAQREQREHQGRASIRRTGRASRYPGPVRLQNVGERDQPKFWVIDADERAVVVRLAQIFIKLGSVRGTAMALNNAHIPSPGGSTWSPQTVGDVLRSPLVRGKYRHGVTRKVARRGTIVGVKADPADVLEIDHPDLAILSPALIARVDERLSKLGRVARGAATPRTLLRVTSNTACAAAA